MTADEQEVAELARELRIADHVTLVGHGPVDPDRVYPKYEQIARHVLSCGWRRD